MTTYNKSSLKTYFETNDVPTGGNYADLIDSNLNLVETAIQSMAGQLYTTKLITPNVSAASITNTGTTNSVNASITGTASIASLNVSTNAAFTGTFTSNFATVGVVSAGDVYASTTKTTYLKSDTPTIVSAAGTTQATAVQLGTTAIVRGQGSTDGSATGYALTSNNAGLIQYFVHEGAVSANLWPPTGGTINGLSANAAFGLAANTLYTVIHKTASAYAVK